MRQAAEDLGVCRTHLWRVINGHRKSRRLLTRYADWRKHNGTTTPTPKPYKYKYKETS